jgi:hypothetical protein
LNYYFLSKEVSHPIYKFFKKMVKETGLEKYQRLKDEVKAKYPKKKISKYTTIKELEKILKIETPKEIEKKEIEKKEKSRKPDRSQLWYQAKKRNLTKNINYRSTTAEQLEKLLGSEELINELIEFQSSGKSIITFYDVDPAAIQALLNAIVVRPNYHTTIKAGEDKYYTVNQTTLPKLADFFNYIEEYSDSDGQMATFLVQHREMTIMQKPIVEKRQSEKQGGAFFRYLNPTKIDLTRQGVYNELNKENYKYNCLELALRNSNLFEESIYQDIRLQINDRNVPIKNLKAVADICKTQIILKVVESNRNNVRKFGKYEQKIEIGLLVDHYFLIEPTKYTSYAIKNYEKINDKENWNRFYANGRRTNEQGFSGGKYRFLDSFELISQSKHLMTPITLDSENIHTTQYYDKVDKEIVSLEYPDSAVKAIRKPQSKKQAEQTEQKVYYADFESTTDGDKHEAYMCCVVSKQTEMKTFHGEYSGHQLLEHLEDNSIVYFHNLGYDMSFLVKYLNIQNIIKTGSMVKTLSGNFNGKRLTFRDSYSMIPDKLKNFSEMFGLSSKKEIMPYKVYTQKNITLNSIPLKEALAVLNADMVKEDEKVEEVFTKLAEDNDCLMYSEEGELMFNHIKYAQFYCEQDCQVLMEGFETFRGWIQEAFNLDALDYISLPSLSYAYLHKESCLDGLYEVASTPRIFIQKCVKGGRVMVRDNKKLPVQKELNDFDAVSLYPSAMSQMGFLKGKPKVIPQGATFEQLSQYDGYFVEITNVKTSKHLHFPLQSTFADNRRNYVNVFNKEDVLCLDKIALNDFVKYQGATFDLKRGYYYDEGFNNKIQETMTYLFSKRLEHKNAGNKIEKVYKLLMNASYGKMIQKPIKTDLKFTNTADQHDKFVNYNHNYIKHYESICKDKYVYTVSKATQNHFNLAHIGCEILSMSKRIMNEVMCLAEDLDIEIYYQDTDSMHVENDKIQTLSDAFKAKFGKELIGKNMGQFHCDFALTKKLADENKKCKALGLPKKYKEEDIVSVESYFLGKKSYIDKLRMPNGDESYHIRMKGVPVKCITDKAADPMEIYERLNNGEVMSFDLAKGMPSFKRNSDFSTSSNKEFIRKVKF